MQVGPAWCCALEITLYHQFLYAPIFTLLLAVHKLFKF